MLLDLFNVGLVHEVARHCNGVLQVLNLMRAPSWYKEEVSRCKVDTEILKFNLSLINLVIRTCILYKTRNQPIMGQGTRLGV